MVVELLHSGVSKKQKATVGLRLRGDQAAAVHISQSPVGVERLLLGVRRLGLGQLCTRPTLMLTGLPQCVCT